MGQTEIQKLEWELLRRINAVRADPAAAGYPEYAAAPALHMNIALRKAAHDHAETMKAGLQRQETGGWFWPDGSDNYHAAPGESSDLAKAQDEYQAGFGSLASGLQATAHAIQMTSQDTGMFLTACVNGVDDYRDDAGMGWNITGWLESDGHREAMLDPEAKIVGTGIARRDESSGRTSYFFDAIFASSDYVDLYVRDNDDDVGTVPTTGATSESPDILIYADSGRAQARENPEYGEDNFVYVRVHNSGTETAGDFKVYLYWADPGTNLVFPEAWHGESISAQAGLPNCIEADENWIKATGVPSNGGTMDVGPFVWCPPLPTSAVYEEGYFCLYARLVSDQDPIMHEADWSDREYENNLAQLNVTVVDSVAEGECHCSIDLCGQGKIDLRVDPGQITRDGGRVYFRLRSHLLEGVKLVRMQVVETTPEGRFTTLGCTASAPGVIRGLALAKGDRSTVELVVNLPRKAKHGIAYPVRVNQSTDGRRVGSVTLVARLVTNPEYIGNRRSGELHLRACKWVGRMAAHHKKPFRDIETAHKRGYDNCAYCLGGSKR